MSGMYLLTAIIIAIVYLFTYLFGCLSMIKSIDLLVFISYVVNGFVEATALLMKNLKSKLAWFFFQKKKSTNFDYILAPKGLWRKQQIEQINFIGIFRLSLSLEIVQVKAKIGNESFVDQKSET